MVLWIQSRLSVRLSVRPLLTHFSQNWLISFFWFFFIKLGDHKGSTVTEPDFSGKIWFGWFLGKKTKNGLKIDFFDFFSKLNHKFFLILCMKLGDYKASKLTQAVFSGKIWFGWFLGYLIFRLFYYLCPKWVNSENGSKELKSTM